MGSELIIARQSKKGVKNWKRRDKENREDEVLTNEGIIRWKNKGIEAIINRWNLLSYTLPLNFFFFFLLSYPYYHYSSSSFLYWISGLTLVYEKSFLITSGSTCGTPEAHRGAPFPQRSLSFHNSFLFLFLSLPCWTVHHPLLPTQAYPRLCIRYNNSSKKIRVDN